MKLTLKTEFLDHTVSLPNSNKLIKLRFLPLDKYLVIFNLFPNLFEEPEVKTYKAKKNDKSKK